MESLIGYSENYMYLAWKSNKEYNMLCNIIVTQLVH